MLGLLLAFGALIGLFGQQAAYARRVTAVTVVSAPAEDGSDCMAMMTGMKGEPKPAPGPCKGMTLDCIAAMGCVVPLTLGDENRLQARAPAISPRPFWPVARVLDGGDVAPEPHPPSILG